MCGPKGCGFCTIFVSKRVRIWILPRPFWSGIGYCFRGNYGSVWTYLSRERVICVFDMDCKKSFRLSFSLKMIAKFQPIPGLKKGMDLRSRVWQLVWKITFFWSEIGSGFRLPGGTPPQKNSGEYPSTPVFAADVDIKSCPCNKLLNKQYFTTDYTAKWKRHEIESVQPSLAFKRQLHPLWYVTIVNHSSSFNSTNKQLRLYLRMFPILGRKQYDE